MILTYAKGINSASARGGISETGSDSIPNSDKKRTRGAFMNKLGVIFLFGGCYDFDICSFIIRLCYPK